VTCTVAYQDSATSLGLCDRPVTMTQAATVKTDTCPCESGGTCYRPLDLLPFAYSLTCVITLPKVGETYLEGYFDQTFHDTTTTHENWHYEYTKALAEAVYGRLEKWSASYVGNCFHTAASALATGQADMVNARAKADEVYNANSRKDIDDYEHPGTGS